MVGEALPRPVFRRRGLWVGLVLFAAVGGLPTDLRHLPDYGSRPAWAAAVALLMAAWWFTEALPISLTACLPLVLFPALGVFGDGLLTGVGRSCEPFVDAYIFMFLGGMMIGAAMEESHLHRRVAIHIMRAIGTDPRRLLLGLLVATAAVSLWISNTATAVMMMPIAVALLAQLEAAGGGRRLENFGVALMLSVAYAANVGGIGTKIGTGTNSIFCGFVSRELGVEISFGQYVLVGLPFVVVFIPLVWAVLWRLGRRDGFAATDARTTLDGELRAMGAPTLHERKVAAVFLGAAALWIFGDLLRPLIAPRVPAFWPGFRFEGKHYEAAVAMAGGLVLVALRALRLQSFRRIPFGTLLLLGGSFAMAAGIDGSGLSRWMAVKLAGLAGLPLLGQVGLAAGAGVVLSAVASNTATVSVMLNVLPRVLPVLAATTIAASCDFALPAGTPPNAIVFGSGRIRLPVMMRTGFLLDLAAVLLITLYAVAWLPLVF